MLIFLVTIVIYLRKNCLIVTELNKTKIELNTIQKKLNVEKRQKNELNDSLKLLPDILNEVSKSKTTSEILRYCLKHLTENYFGFQFSVINLIDPFNEIVKEWLPSEKHFPEIRHEEWRNYSKYGNEIMILPTNDIILVIARNNDRCIIKVINHEIIFIEGNTLTHPILDPRLGNRFNHDQLTRIFIPLLMDIKDNEKFIFGVVEMGFITNSKYHLELDELLITKIKIYIDNCVQVYHKLYVEEKVKQIERNIQKHESIVDHKIYLNATLREICENFLFNKGEIDIISFDDNEDTWIPNSSESQRYGITDAEVIDLRTKNMRSTGIPNYFGIYRKVFKENSPLYVPNVQNNSDYIPGLSEVKSQFSLPFGINNKKLGVVNFYSNHENFFDKFIRESLVSIYKIICETYTRKKTGYLLSKLVLPLNIFRDKNDVFKNTIEILNEYCVGKMVTIYCKNNELGFPSVQYKIDINGICKMNKTQNPFKYKYPSNNQFTDDSEERTNFKFVLSQGAKARQMYGYIQIESNRKIYISEEDKIFFAQSASKLAITLNFMEFFQAFTDMPVSLAEGRSHEVYNKIEENAKIFFGAEPVLLFKYFNSHKFNLSRFSSSEDLFFKVGEKEASNDTNEYNMVIEVIKHSEIYVVDKEDYLQNWSPDKRNWKAGLFLMDFYEREKIISFAAIKLHNKNEILGVLFLNYRNDIYNKGFDDDFKNRLRTFAELASQTITYTKLLEENKSIRDKNFRAHKPFLDSLIMLGLIHGIENLADVSIKRLHLIREQILKNKNHEYTKDYVLDSIKKVENPIDLLNKSLLNFRTFRNNKGEKFVFVNKLLKNIIDETVLLIKPKCDSEFIPLTVKEFKNENKLFVNVDDNSIKHILVNFIHNAIESIKDQKRGSTRRKEIRLSVDLFESFVHIKVSDSGPGIDESIRSNLFSDYATTKPYGSGMGLPISKYLAEVHIGKVDFKEESSDNGGIWTTFILELPIVK